MPERCTLRWRFCTPVQIVRDGKAVGTQLDGLDLLLAGRRRWGVMNTFYGTGSDMGDDPPVRFDRSDFITHSTKTHSCRVRSNRVINIETGVAS